MYTTMLELAISMVFLFLMLSAASSAIPTEAPRHMPRSGAGLSARRFA